MQTPAITLFLLQDGRAVQTAGFETPVEAQVEALAEAGRLNSPPVAGAVRGEVWTRGHVRAQTFFEPVAAVAVQADEEAAAAEAKRKADEEAAKTNPPHGTPVGGELAHNQPLAGSTPAPATNSTPQQPAAEGTPGSAPGASAAPETSPGTAGKGADEPAAASAPSSPPPPVSGKKKSS